MLVEIVSRGPIPSISSCAVSMIWLRFMPSSMMRWVSVVADWAAVVISNDDASKVHFNPRMHSLPQAAKKDRRRNEARRRSKLNVVVGDQPATPAFAFALRLFAWFSG